MSKVSSNEKSSISKDESLQLDDRNSIEMDRMTTPDDSYEQDFDIVEVERTPAFEDEGRFEFVKKAATILSGDISLINTMVGAGVLSLPMAMYKFGIVLGIIILFIMGFLACVGMIFLARAADGLYKEEVAKNNGKFPDAEISFTWVGRKVSPKTTPILNLIMFLYCTGATIAYLIVVGDGLPVVCRFFIYGSEDSSSSSMSSSSEDEKNLFIRWLTKRKFWIIVIAIIVGPISFAKKLDTVKFFSSFMLPCVMYIIILLIVYAAKDGGGVKTFPRSTTAFSALSVLMFAFSGHMNYYTVYQELGPRNREKRATITSLLSSIEVILIYLVAGVAGYIYGGEDTKGNIINSLPQDSVAATIGRLAITLNVIVAYPVLLNPARNALTGLLDQLFPSLEHVNRNAMHCILTAIIFIISLVSLFINSIDVVLGFCGAIGSSMTTYIFPGLYYYMVYRNEPTKKVKCGLAIVFIVLGFIFMIVGFILQIMDLV